MAAGIAVTGEVPQAVAAPAGRAGRWIARRELAGRLFVTGPDVWPLMILMVALTGRSPDAVKELPAGHRVLENQAVELVLVKRRRGPGRWHETVTWETGPPGRELHHAGGFYLLLHQLMAAGRNFSKSPLVWSVWRNAAEAAAEAARRLGDFGEQARFRGLVITDTRLARRPEVCEVIDS